MRLCVSYPNEIVFMNFTICRVFFIYSGGIWLDCGCVMCILKVGPSVGPNPVTGKGIGKTTSCIQRDAFLGLWEVLELRSRSTCVLKNFLRDSHRLGEIHDSMLTTRK